MCFVAPAPGVDADVAFVSRDVTGLSTKHAVLPETQALLRRDAGRAEPALGARCTPPARTGRCSSSCVRRGVALTHLVRRQCRGRRADRAGRACWRLPRHFPQLMAAQREHAWAPLIGSGLPRDLAGQTAVIVGWGPIGQQIGALLRAAGAAARRGAQQRRSRGPGHRDRGLRESGAGAAARRLAGAGLSADRAHARAGRCRGAGALPAGARLVNVARGEVVDEPALIAALQQAAPGRRLPRRLRARAARRGLAAVGPARTSSSRRTARASRTATRARVARMFLDNLAAWRAGQPIRDTLLL